MAKRSYAQMCRHCLKRCGPFVKKGGMQATKTTVRSVGGFCLPYNRDAQRNLFYLCGHSWSIERWHLVEEEGPLVLRESQGLSLTTLI